MARYLISERQYQALVRDAACLPFQELPALPECKPSVRVKQTDWAVDTIGLTWLEFEFSGSSRASLMTRSAQAHALRQALAVLADLGYIVLTDETDRS